MSIFNSYSKPGKGISREEAEKRNYFAILSRKITLLIKTNLLFFGVNIIPIALLALLALPLLAGTSEPETESIVNSLASIITGKRLMSPFPFIALWLFSPTIPGITYLCRNYAKQTPVFLASDFFEQTKKNLKQSIIAGFIMTVVLYLYLTALFFYSSSSTIMTCFTLMFGIVLAAASFYVFPLMVTFDMPLIAIFKNSLLFSLLNSPQNILVLAVLIALHTFLILKLPLIWVFLMIFFLIAFSSYTMNFVVWNAISKHMDI